MLLALLVFAVGLGLSAFFSGSETGFYRVARVRLLIDALAGDWLARCLLVASNNPAAFVATALVGNNVSNNVTALAVVMATKVLLPQVAFAELLLTLAVTPVVFIFGELLPKQLFFRAPYRLLRRCSPGLAAAGVLFAPFSLLLWLVSQVLRWISRAPTQTIRMALARRELSGVLDEGRAVGLLSPVQRGIAQNAFTLGGRPIREFVTPAGRQTRATPRMTRHDVLRLARRLRQPELPVETPAERNAGDKEVLGYVSAVDCLLGTGEAELPVRPLTEALATTPMLSVLLDLQKSGEPVAAVRGAGGELVGFVTVARLRAALLDDEG